jgi:hypothetical protein
METRGLKLAASAPAKEKRLAALLAERSLVERALEQAVVAAQVRGSLELAGPDGAADDPEATAALRRAVAAVDPSAPFSVEALVAWQAALTGDGGLRQRPRDRAEGPPPAPPEFIASRLAITQEWLSGDSGRELAPAQQGALALARIVEILPFDRSNGIVGRLAASHLMVRAGSRRPILVGGDAPRLREALSAAFQLQTEPLARLLDEGAERALDVLIAAASSAAAPGGRS